MTSCWRVGSIINGKARISAQMAIKLAKAFNTTPHYCLNLQAKYDIWQISKNDKEIDKVEVLV